MWMGNGVCKGCFKPSESSHPRGFEGLLYVSNLSFKDWVKFHQIPFVPF